MPTQFFAQLLARIQAKSPRFFILIQRAAIGLVALSLVLYYVVHTALPGMQIAVPLWLSFTQSQLVGLTGFLSGLGLGAFGVANVTIQTPSTPELDQTPSKPTVEDLASEIALLKAQLTKNES